MDGGGGDGDADGGGGDGDTDGGGGDGDSDGSVHAMTTTLFTTSVPFPSTTSHCCVE